MPHKSTSRSTLFVKDPSILFGHGNSLRFSFKDRDETGNSLARMVTYASVSLAILLEDPRYALYGLIAIVAIGCWFNSSFAGDVPLNESYHPGGKTKLARVHDLALGQTQAQQDTDLRNMLLSNVREQNYYLGEEYGMPNGVDYMFGGTRSDAPNRTDALRNNRYFKNVHDRVFYEPPRPVYEF